MSGRLRGADRIRACRAHAIMTSSNANAARRFSPSQSGNSETDSGMPAFGFGPSVNRLIQIWFGPEQVAQRLVHRAEECAAAPRPAFLVGERVRPRRRGFGSASDCSAPCAAHRRSSIMGSPVARKVFLGPPGETRVKPGTPELSLRSCRPREGWKDSGRGGFPAEAPPWPSRRSPGRLPARGSRDRTAPLRSTMIPAFARPSIKSAVVEGRTGRTAGVQALDPEVPGRCACAACGRGRHIDWPSPPPAWRCGSYSCAGRKKALGGLENLLVHWRGDVTPPFDASHD